MERIIAIAWCNRSTKLVITRPGFNSHQAVADGADSLLHVTTAHKSWQKGFFTNLGRFVDRREAMQIARAADQLKPSVKDGDIELFSDHLR